jgi:DNA-binding NarL/FixJ family response regulator
MLHEYSNTTDSDGNPDYNSLTSREIEIIQLLSDGLYTKEIADKLFISDKTIERHKTNILKKLKLRNTAQLIKVAIIKGIIVS